MTSPDITPGAAIKALKDLLGPQGWLTDESDIEPYLIEERGIYRGSCAGVALPASTKEVAAAVKICAGAGIAMIPQGGNTGLVGGGVPDGGVVIGLKRMNRIIEIDPANMTLKAEAGAILAHIQDAAFEAGCLFPLSLGAEDSCQIGGNVSTNAGGVQVLRYGTTRDMVLGLEAVLPDGRVFDGMRSLSKDNTGYDLKHLFIGAEGTLGIITAVALKLYPRPPYKETAMAAVSSLDSALDLFTLVRAAAGGDLTAFEMLSDHCLSLAVKHIPQASNPFGKDHPYYCLIELAGNSGQLRPILESALEKALGTHIIADAVIAKSESQVHGLWRLRESVPEAQRLEGGSIKHDVAVPVSKIPEFVESATRAVERELKGVRVVAFGHMGDGNIHFNLSQPQGMERQAFMDMWDGFNRLVHDLVHQMGGSFSAEHGIGRLKLDDMKRYKSDVELELMRAVKKALDPKGIMNPGKVIGP